MSDDAWRRPDVIAMFWERSPTCSARADNMTDTQDGASQLSRSYEAASGAMIDSAVSIRRATADDAHAIATVHVASWRTTYVGIVRQSYIDRLSVEERASAWLRRLSDVSPAAPDVLLAESPTHGPVGFVSGGVIREPENGFDAELYAIYLLSTAQKIGLGRRLVREWARLAVERGRRAAVVRVLAANPACRFYERLGARRLKDAELSIGGDAYPEIWYGWSTLRDLTA